MKVPTGRSGGVVMKVFVSADGEGQWDVNVGAEVVFVTDGPRGRTQAEHFAMGWMEGWNRARKAGGALHLVELEETHDRAD